MLRKDFFCWRDKEIRKCKNEAFLFFDILFNQFPLWPEKGRLKNKSFTIFLPVLTLCLPIDGMASSKAMVYCYFYPNAPIQIILNWKVLGFFPFMLLEIKFIQLLDLCYIYYIHYIQMLDHANFILSGSIFHLPP